MFLLCYTMYGRQGQWVNELKLMSLIFPFWMLFCSLLWLVPRGERNKPKDQSPDKKKIRIEHATSCSQNPELIPWISPVWSSTVFLRAGPYGFLTLVPKWPSIGCWLLGTKIYHLGVLSEKNEDKCRKFLTKLNFFQYETTLHSDTWPIFFLFLVLKYLFFCRLLTLGF